jgi:hypothetical protein
MLRLMDIIKNLKEMRQYHQDKVDEFTSAMRKGNYGSSKDYAGGEYVHSRGIHEAHVKTCDKAIEAITGKSE